MNYYLVLNLIWAEQDMDRTGRSRRDNVKQVEPRHYNGLGGMKSGEQRGFDWCIGMSFLVYAWSVKLDLAV